MFKLGDLFSNEPYQGYTPERLDNRRLLLSALMARSGEGSTTGTGIVSLATGVLGGLQNRRLDKTEDMERQKATDVFNAAMGGWSPFTMGSDTLTGSAGGDTLSVDGVTPAAKAAYDALTAGWGNPLTVTSAYRSPEHNAKVGGAKNSQHTHGNAFDISTAGMSQAEREQLIRKAQEAGFTGIGVYDNSLHFDVGPARAWGPDYSRNSLPDWAAPLIGGGGTGNLAGGAGMDRLTGAPIGPAGGPIPQPVPIPQPTAPMGGGGTSGPMTGQAGGDMLGGNSAGIYQALANPWLSQEQRAALMAMLEQNDPLRQLQLREAQLRVQAMENPEPDELTQRAIAGGLMPGSPEWQQFMLNNGQMPQPEAAPAGVQELEYRARQAGLEPGTPEWRQFMLTDGKPTQGTWVPATPEQAAAYGAQAGQFGPDGRFYPAEIPQGMSIESDGQGGFRVVQGAASAISNVKPLTEAQSKDVGFATRAESALVALEPVANKLTERGDAALGWLPFGAGRGMQEPDYQLAEQAGRELLLAILRKDTGAAITNSEEATYTDVYLPRPGDSPKLLERKKVARMAALEGLKAGMSPAQLLAQGQAIMKSGTAPAAPPAAGPDNNDPLGLFGNN